MRYLSRLCDLSRQLICPGLLFALCSATSPALAVPLAPTDFAYGMRLTISANEALHELPLPRDAYLRAICPDLADIRVFNGADQPVPFALIPPAALQAPAETRPLPLFPMPAKEAATASGVALQIRTNANGAIVSIATRPGEVSEKPPSVYILDASRLERPVAGIELDWGVPAGNYLGIVEIMVSDDLAHWAFHATVAVASLRTNGESLERRTVQFPALKAKYFRLTLAPERDVPRLTGATAKLAPATAEPSRNWVTIPAVMGSEGRGKYYADTGGHLPIDRLRIRFPEENSIVRATFFSRPDGESPWTVRQRGLLYRLRQGGKELESAALELPATTDRYWRMQIEESGGLGGSIPQLEVGWLPHRLVFVARGPAPFLLAYGSARDGICTVADDSVLATIEGNQRKKLTPALATAGPQEKLGGTAALRPRMPATTWKQVLLWGILIFGVALLGWMAAKLYREMSQ